MATVEWQRTEAQEKTHPGDQADGEWRGGMNEWITGTRRQEERRGHSEECVHAMELNQREAGVARQRWQAVKE